MENIGNLQDPKTLGSNLSDYLNHIRKQEIYRKQYGTDIDFVMIDKVHYGGLPYPQTFAYLDYKRKGIKPDDLTYTEIDTYNKVVFANPDGVLQLVKVDIFILGVELEMNGYGRSNFEHWDIKNISISKYLKGNPRPEESGLKAALVVNGKEIRETTTRTRADLEIVETGLTFPQFMDWELQYRKRRTKEVIEVLQLRDYCLGRASTF